MTSDLFDKYIWLVDTIYRAEKITFEDTTVPLKWTNRSLKSLKISLL